MPTAPLRFRRALRDDFRRIAEIVESSYPPHDPGARLPGRHPTDLSGPPFVWFGAEGTSWWLAERNGRGIGYALWRHVGRNVHLHALFVAGTEQRQGVGSQLLELHAREALRENPRVETFTLHVREEAIWARRFYLDHGYVERDPRTLSIDDDNGLGDWARAYEVHGWPEPGKILMVRERAG